MAHTRAMLASIGASVVLVAAAALALLAISAVFAFGGWADPVTTSVARPALILAATTRDAQEGTKRPPVVLPAPSRPSPRRAAPPPATAPAAPAVRRPAIGGVTGSARVAVQPAPRPEPAPTPSAPAAGDGVRKVGKDLSGTVQSAGSALAEATQPLGPPISAAVQQVLNVIAALLRRSTDGVGDVVDGLGGTVDGLLAPK